jgi:hypothetical protein
MEEEVNVIAKTKDQYFAEIWDKVSPLDLTTEQGKMDFTRIICDENHESVVVVMNLLMKHQEALVSVINNVTLIMESLTSLRK